MIALLGFSEYIVEVAIIAPQRPKSTFDGEEGGKFDSGCASALLLVTAACGVVEACELLNPTETEDDELLCAGKFIATPKMATTPKVKRINLLFIVYGRSE